MTLPASFAKSGFVSPDKIRKGRRLLIGTEGPADSGKTEFALSAPGPGVVVCLDRGFDPMLDNPNPPKTRQESFAFQVVTAPLSGQASQPEYLEYWKRFYASFRAGLDLPEARTVVVDGDSDSWELQRLAEFGKLLQVPPILYSAVNSARRGMYARAWDSGKIVIATNKISKDYKAILDKQGNPVMKDGKEVREWDGASYKRQGFADQDYLFNIQLRHLFRNTEAGPEWGIMIMKCKVDQSLVGLELWGEDCNFQSLVQTVYPHVSLEEWGYR